MLSSERMSMVIIVMLRVLPGRKKGKDDAGDDGEERGIWQVGRNGQRASR